MKRTRKYYELMGQLEERGIDTTPELMETYCKIRKLAMKHHRLAEMDCNGEGFVHGKFYRCDGSVPGSYLEDGETTIFCAEQEKIEERISALVSTIGLKVEYQGDPRGCTVRLSTMEGKFVPIPFA